MDETQLPPDGGQSRSSEEARPSNAMPAASTMLIPTSDEHDDFPEDALLENEAAGWSAQFVVPFQQSGLLSAMNPQTARASTNQAGAPAQGRTTPRRFPILKVTLISALIVLAVGFLALSVFAQPATHLTTAAKNPTQGPLVTHTALTARPTPAVQKISTPTMTTDTPQATPPSDWVPSAQTLQQLGWMGAGLSTGDALEAERTAWTFTDREMSLDYRNAGTRAQHSGTFTAAVFLLTPNARVRFFANDVRVINEERLDMADHLFGPHQATLRAREKQALLPGGVHVQKTVSLLLGGRLVLVTSIGDHILERADRYAIAAKLGLSSKAAQQATLNPPGCIAEQVFGLLRGMVSPFLPAVLPAGFGTGLHAVVQLSWPTVWEDEGQSVAISLSPCESLLIPLRCYRRILHRYVRWSIPDVPLVELNVLPGVLYSGRQSIQDTRRALC